MKNRLLCVAMAAFFAVGMISCGNPAEPEDTDFEVTTDNVDNYITSLGSYEGLTVEAEKKDFTDETVEYYAKHYYETLAKETEGMTDENGDPIPMTDDAIKMLDTDVYTTVNEFMVFVRGTVRDYIDYSYNNDIAEGVIEQCTGASEFAELPDALINKEKASLEEDYTDIAAEYDVTVEKYFKLLGTTLEDEAVNKAKEELVLFKIAKDQGIEETDSESLKDQVTDYLVSVTNVK